jgi:hypothetical protein
MPLAKGDDVMSTEQKKKTPPISVIYHERQTKDGPIYRRRLAERKETAK